MDASRESGSLPLAVAAMGESWDRSAKSGLLSPATAAQYQRQLEAFAAFSLAHGVRTLTDVTESLCMRWISARHPLRDSRSAAAPPGSVSTSSVRIRHGVLSSAMSAWLEAGLITQDPLLPLQIERNARKPSAPLTPVEVSRLRRPSNQGVSDHVAAAAMAAALAGAAQSEIARLTISDVHFDDATLTLAGRGRSGVRTIQVGPGGLAALETRLQEVARASRRAGSPGSTQEAPLALRRPLSSYSPHAVAPAVASTLSRAMKRAGITRVGIRPGSLRDYAANRTYAITGRVEDVADVVGLASLDRARALVDPEWQARWADAARLDEG